MGSAPVAIARPFQRFPTSEICVQSKSILAEKTYHHKTLETKGVSPNKFDNLRGKQKTIGVVEPRVVVKIPWSKVNQSSHSRTHINPGRLDTNSGILPAKRSLSSTIYSEKKRKKYGPYSSALSETKYLSPSSLSNNIEVDTKNGQDKKEAITKSTVECLDRGKGFVPNKQDSTCKFNVRKGNTRRWNKRKFHARKQTINRMKGMDKQLDQPSVSRNVDSSLSYADQKATQKKIERSELNHEEEKRAMAQEDFDNAVNTETSDAIRCVEFANGSQKNKSKSNKYPSITTQSQDLSSSQMAEHQCDIVSDILPEHFMKALKEHRLKQETFSKTNTSPNVEAQNNQLDSSQTNPFTENLSKHIESKSNEQEQPLEINRHKKIKTLKLVRKHVPGTRKNQYAVSKDAFKLKTRNALKRSGLRETKNNNSSCNQGMKLQRKHIFSLDDSLIQNGENDEGNQNNILNLPYMKSECCATNFNLCNDMLLQKTEKDSCK